MIAIRSFRFLYTRALSFLTITCKMESQKHASRFDLRYDTYSGLWCHKPMKELGFECDFVKVVGIAVLPDRRDVGEAALVGVGGVVGTVLRDGRLQANAGEAAADALHALGVVAGAGLGLPDRGACEVGLAGDTDIAVAVLLLHDERRCAGEADARLRSSHAVIVAGLALR